MWQLKEKLNMHFKKSTNHVDEQQLLHRYKSHVNNLWAAASFDGRRLYWFVDMWELFLHGRI